MTDGVYLDTAEHAETSVNLDNFIAWIELQPQATVAGLLDIIGTDLYRRERWVEGNDVKEVVSRLRRA